MSGLIAKRDYLHHHRRFQEENSVSPRLSRASGTAPRTCATVAVSTSAAPLGGLPVGGSATKAKAIEPAACGTLNAA